jgi:hypothetical protein
VARNVLTGLWLACLVAGATLLFASCRGGGDENTPRTPAVFPWSGEDSEIPDILTTLHQPGKVTYVRYTDLRFGWAIRTAAWLDFEGGRARRWDITQTDSAENPAVCTYIQQDGRWYGCLPFVGAVEGVETEGAEEYYEFSPMRDGDEIRLGLLHGELPSATLVGDPEVTETDLFGVPMRTFRWDAVPPPEWEDTYGDACSPKRTPTNHFEYTVDSEGLPVSELFLTKCDGEDTAGWGIIYHEVKFLDPDSLPSYLFDPQSSRDEMVANAVSGFMRGDGKVYWLGWEDGPYLLAGMEPCGDGCLSLQYAVPNPTSYTEQTLTLTIGDRTTSCYHEQPLDLGMPGGKLCSEREGVVGPEYRALWQVDGVTITLESGGEPPISYDEFAVAAKQLKAYDGPLSSKQATMLTEDDVRELVADTLDLGCPRGWETIREDSDSADFKYDEASSEWRGTFGPFGDFTVSDAKPVVNPVAAVDETDWPANLPQCAEEPEEEQEASSAGLGLAYAGLQSYRYRTQVETQSPGAAEFAETTYMWEGAFVAPDRGQESMKGSNDGVDVEGEFDGIIIGDKMWMRLGGDWAEMETLTRADQLGPPGLLLDFNLRNLTSLEGTEETVNDVPSLHYQFGRDEISGLGKKFAEQSHIFGEEGEPRDLPADLQVDLWLAEDGNWPVRMLVSASDVVDGEETRFKFSLDVTDVNDPSIKIEAPLP